MAKARSRTGITKSADIEVLKIDPGITELLRTMKSAGHNDPGYRMEELCAMSGHGIRWIATKVIRPGLESGKIKRGTRMMQRIDGVETPVPVYRLAKEKRDE